MALTISAQFDKFVEFAQTQRNPRTSTALAVKSLDEASYNDVQRR